MLTGSVDRTSRGRAKGSSEDSKKFRFPWGSRESSYSDNSRKDPSPYEDQSHLFPRAQDKKYARYTSTEVNASNVELGNLPGHGGIQVRTDVEVNSQA